MDENAQLAFLPPVRRVRPILEPLDGRRLTQLAADWPQIGRMRQSSFIAWAANQDAKRVYAFRVAVMEDLPRSARPTRGKRITKLIEEELEADDAFWSQDALKEEAETVDKEYEQEEVEVADEFDSDFDEEEPESDDGEAQEEKEVKKKKKLPYKGADKKKKSVSFLLSGAISIPRLGKSSIPKKKAPRPKPPPRPKLAEDDNEEERTVRKSSRTAVVIKQAARDAIRATQSTPKPVKKKKEGEKRLTQEDMLLEAAQTEVINLQSLERMLAREEEVKKKAIVQKTVYTGPLIRFISKNGRNVLEFTKTNCIPSAINSRRRSYPERNLCVVTGLPARYKDPKTGLPYATKEAFKVLRERYAKSEKPGSRKDSLEEIHQRKRTRVETERATGVARLRYKRSSPSTSTKDLLATATGAQPAATVIAAPATVNRPPPAPAPPVEIEPVNEDDFLLDELEVKAPYDYDSACQGLSFEPDEMAELEVAGALWSRIQQQQPSHQD